MGSFNEADSLHAYKSKLHACPPLDRETERDLARRWIAGDRRAGERVRVDDRSGASIFDSGGELEVELRFEQRHPRGRIVGADKDRVSGVEIVNAKVPREAYHQPLRHDLVQSREPRRNIKINHARVTARGQHGHFVGQLRLIFGVDVDKSLHPATDVVG